MRHSIVLRTEPSVQQAEKVIARIERELGTRGVVTHREGSGRLRFRVPAPWKAPKAGLLLAIGKGAVRVSAGSGEQRQVRYEISFARLAGIAVGLSVILLSLGLGWPRLTLIASLAGVWALLFGVPYLVSAARFHRLMAYAARDVIERRAMVRPPRGAMITGEGPATGSAPDVAPDIAPNDAARGEEKRGE
jgi:hypothetical protein